MDPFKYQQKLIDEALVSNEEAYKALMESIGVGHTVTCITRLYGPYTIQCTYWISDGSIIHMVEAASLHWVPLDIMGNYR